MLPVTNQMLNARREKDCLGFTSDRKFFKVGKTWIKRSLRQSEWQFNPSAGSLMVPSLGVERLLNEGAVLEFLAKHTDIPVPELHSCFEDDGAVYLVMEYVEGITMDRLNAHERKVIEAELDGYVATLRKLKSAAWGGPSGIVIPPNRLMRDAGSQVWKMKPRESEDLVFCHNDFCMRNVIVDPFALKVNAIVDWECAGFFPQQFEGMFFRRPGSSSILEGEENDEVALLDIMLDNELPAVGIFGY